MKQNTLDSLVGRIARQSRRHAHEVLLALVLTLAAAAAVIAAVSL